MTYNAQPASPCAHAVSQIWSRWCPLPGVLSLRLQSRLSICWTDVVLIDSHCHLDLAAHGGSLDAALDAVQRLNKVVKAVAMSRIL